MINRIFIIGAAFDGSHGKTELKSVSGLAIDKAVHKLVPCL